MAYDTASSVDPAGFVGLEVRQDQGLHLRYPRGYSNRTAFRDGPHPLNDPYGTYGTIYNTVEHRVPIVGDFDLRVDLSDLLVEGTGAYVGLGISETRVEEASDYIRLVLRWDNQIVMTHPGGNSFMTSPPVPTTLRFVRSDSTVTAYAWNSLTSTWQTQTGWTLAFPSVPTWVSLITYMPGVTATSATFKNYLHNATTSPNLALTGTFTSPVYDAGRNVVWQNISWVETLPASTNIEFQVAFADDSEGPWNYIGPDGTSGTKFTTPDGESVGASKISRYSRIKAYLTGTGSATPALGSLELSYGGNLSSQYRKFAYDDAGNLTQVHTRTDSATVEETRTYDDLNQIVDNQIDNGSLVTWTYTHSTNGNLTSKTDGTDTYDYLWDDLNRLVGVELNSTPVVTYEYDSKSRLLQRNCVTASPCEGGATTNYHWNGWSLVREEKTGSVTETTNYLVPAGAFERGGNWFYMHGDALSSTQLVTDENGAQVGRFIYGAWGEELYASESVPGVLENRFVGGLGCRRDAATGLIYMRHRWYDPALMRFISRDPIGMKGGAHLYKYAGNNPVNFTDSTGLDVIIDNSWNTPAQVDELSRANDYAYKNPYAQPMIDAMICSDIKVIVRIKTNMVDSQGNRLPAFTHTPGDEYVRMVVGADGKHQVAGGVIQIDIDLAEARRQYGADVTMDEILVHEYTHAYRNITNPTQAYSEWWNSDVSPGLQERVPISQTEDYLNYRNSHPGNR